MGELLVVAAAHPEQVWRVRQQVRVDLDDGADHGERPVRPHPRHLADHRVIDPLVHHAHPAEDRAGHEVNVRRHDRRGVGRLVEVVELDAAAEHVDVVVLFALLVAQMKAAGEDDVGVLHQAGLVQHQRLGGAGELRELVHAVVHDAAVFNVTERPARVHRAVVPEQRPLEGAVLVEILDRLLGPPAQQGR